MLLVSRTLGAAKVACDGACVVRVMQHTHASLFSTRKKTHVLSIRLKLEEKIIPEKTHAYCCVQKENGFYYHDDEAA